MFKTKNTITQEDHEVEIRRITRDFTDRISRIERSHENEVESLTQTQTHTIQDMEQTHKLELKEQEFKMSHHKDKELLAMKNELDAAKTDLLVTQNENKMLREITNINGDIIDIKDLVSKLIDKLPSINLNSLTVQGNGK